MAYYLSGVAGNRADDWLDRVARWPTISEKVRIAQA